MCMHKVQARVAVQAHQVLNNTNLGWHDLTSSYVTVHSIQYEDTGPYTANYVQWQLQTTKTLVQVFKQIHWVDAAADQQAYNKSIYNVQDQVDGTHRMTIRL